MTGMQIALTAVAGAALVAIVYELIKKQKLGETNALEAVFGVPMVTTKFSRKEAVEWIKAHHKSGSKGIIFKAGGSALKELAPKLNLGEDLEHCLVMAIVNESSKKVESGVLVKFDELDSGLLELLGEEEMVVIEE